MDMDENFSMFSEYHFSICLTLLLCIPIAANGQGEGGLKNRYYTYVNANEDDMKYVYRETNTFWYSDIETLTTYYEGEVLQTCPYESYSREGESNERKVVFDCKSKGKTAVFAKSGRKTKVMYNISTEGRSDFSQISHIYSSYEPNSLADHMW